jgi:uncharacterized protein YabN with tetrapyrrole methylase and pyrophosphatase domain
MPGAELAVGEALLALDEVTRRLRRECPWDREQDERSIVPHTVEEAYELADAAHSGDDAKLVDELGDVLFQVYFLALLLEERGKGDLPTVARHVTDKLIRRHPPETPAQVKENWDAIKRTEGKPSDDPLAGVPETLPALMYARKLQRRAAGGTDRSDPQDGLDSLRKGLERLSEAPTACTRRSAACCSARSSLHAPFRWTPRSRSAVPHRRGSHEQDHPHQGTPDSRFAR